MQDCFFFERSGHRLFACLYRPDKPAQRNRIGLVLCDPFAEEKLWSQRVMVNLARDLADNGYTVLRFDYMGHGDSENTFEESDIESRLADIAKAIEVIKERSGITIVGLLGLRLGATLAAFSAERNNNIDFMLLLEPVVDVKKYINQSLRSNLAMQMATYKKIKYTREEMIQDLLAGNSVNIDGYMMSGRFYHQGIEINLEKMPLSYSKSVLIVHIARVDNGKVPQSITLLNNQYCKLNSKTMLKIVEEKPFWSDTKIYYQKSEKLLNAALTFLDQI